MKNKFSRQINRSLFLRNGMYFVLVIMVFVLLPSACKDKNEIAVESDVYYTCSMDPQVKEYLPGKCPICKMEMTPVKKSKQENVDEIQLSDQQIQLGNITTDTIQQGQAGDELILTATLNIDPRRTTSISARVMGRVEKLYYKNTGDYVRKGSPLYTLYSEDLNNAKQEYLLALENKKEFSSGSIIDFDRLIESSKNKLLLYGMSEKQIQNLALNSKSNFSTTTFHSSASGYITQIDIQEGDYVMEGTTIVKLADLSRLLVEAQVFTSQLAGIDRHALALVRLPESDETEIKGKIEFVNPEINPETRVDLLRLSIPNQGNKLKPGMMAYVVIERPFQHTFSLPTDAVIRDGKGSLIWKAIGNNYFKHVMVETGIESNDRIEILSGVAEGDVVVVTGSYLLHSEYIFKKGSQQLGAHQH